MRNNERIGVMRKGKKGLGEGRWGRKEELEKERRGGRRRQQ